MHIKHGQDALTFRGDVRGHFPGVSGKALDDHGCLCNFVKNDFFLLPTHAKWLDYCRIMIGEVLGSEPIAAECRLSFKNKHLDSG